MAKVPVKKKQMTSKGNIKDKFEILNKVPVQKGKMSNKSAFKKMVKTPKENTIKEKTKIDQCAKKIKEVAVKKINVIKPKRDPKTEKISTEKKIKRSAPIEQRLRPHKYTKTTGVIKRPLYKPTPTESKMDNRVKKIAPDKKAETYATCYQTQSRNETKSNFESPSENKCTQKNKDPEKFSEEEQTDPYDVTSSQIENLTATSYFTRSKSLPDVKKPSIGFKMEPFTCLSNSDGKNDLEGNTGVKDLESAFFDDGAQVNIKLLHTPQKNSFIKDEDLITLKEDLLTALKASIEEVPSNEETPVFRAPSGKKLQDLEEAIQNAVGKSVGDVTSDDQHPLVIEIEYFNLNFFVAIRKSI